MKFDLKLRWIDDRLDYLNLNDDPFKNVVPTPMVQKMWKPPIRFENTQERPLLEFNPSFSNVILFRKGRMIRPSVFLLTRLRKGIYITKPQH